MLFFCNKIYFAKKKKIEGVDFLHTCEMEGCN